MPRYRYVATGPDGKRVEGTLDAPSLNEVSRSLAERGLRVTSATPEQEELPAAPARKSASGASRSRARRLSDRHLALLLHQMGNLLGSGMRAHEALRSLTQGSLRADVRVALEQMAAGTAERSSLAEAMALHPRLFPASVVGMVRAGEAGGFVPEAFHRAAELRESAASLGVCFWWLWPSIYNLVLTFPVVGIVNEGLRAMGEAAQRGEMVLLPALLKGWGAGLTGPWAWLTLGVLAITLALHHGVRSGAFRTVTHRLGASYGPLKSRARGEAWMTMAWLLSRLSAAGLAPHVAWGLAARAVPNEPLATRLAAMGERLAPGERISQAVRRSGLAGPMAVGAIETGEMTGTLPQALAQIAAGEEAPVRAAGTRAVWRFGCSGLLILILATVLVGALVKEGLMDAVRAMLAE